MTTGGTTNNMPIVGDVGVLQATFVAIQKWLKRRFDTFVGTRANGGANSFENQAKAYRLIHMGGWGAIPGTDAEGRWLMHAGVQDVVFNAGGDGTLTYPTAFPAGTLTAIAMASTGTGTQDILIWTTGLYANAFTLRRNVAAAATIRVNYIAIGY